MMSWLVLCFVFAFAESQQVDLYNHSSFAYGNVTRNSDRADYVNNNVQNTDVVNSAPTVNRHMQTAEDEYDLFVIHTKTQQLVKNLTIITPDLNSALDGIEKLKVNEEERGEFCRLFSDTTAILNAIRNGGAIDIDHNNINKYLKGLKKNAHGQLVLTNHIVADLKSHPNVYPLNYSGFEHAYSIDPKNMELIKFGISDTSANYSNIFEQNTQRDGLMSYSFVRYKVEKYDVRINEDDLRINSEFYDEIQRSLQTTGLHLATARKLLAIIQKYGWYLPLHYKTGGFFYLTHMKKIYSIVESFNHCNKLWDCFQLAANRSLSNIANSPSNCARINQILDQNMGIRLSPGNCIRNSSLVDMYKDTLREQKQYKIIEYKHLLPTLLLLKNYNNALLSQAIKLLSEYRVDLQQEEADINIREYALAMEQLLYNNH